MNKLDFFLWGHIKETVYKNRPQTLSEIKLYIVEAITRISPEVLKNVIQEFQNRLSHCLAVNGYQFEQFL